MPTPHIYLAPMEGVTTFLYRRAHAAVYGPLDKYFTPFLEPREKRSMKTKERNEVLPEHNKSLNVVPQILTNHAAGFLELAGTLWEMGYREINLNLGCPSKTVVTRGKGSGFLAAPEELDRFFDAVYKGLPGEMKLSERPVSVWKRTKNSNGCWPFTISIRYPSLSSTPDYSRIITKITREKQRTGTRWKRAKRLYATTATYLRKGRSGSLRPNFRRKIA